MSSSPHPSVRFAGLLDGAACFAADLEPADAAHLVFVRSPHAHARVVSIHTGSASDAPGVIGVFVAEDLDLVPVWEIHIIDESLGQPPLASKAVHYVGERVVAVVAATLAAAIDAAELVEVIYEPLPPVLDPTTACNPETRVLHAHTSSNEALGWQTVPEQPLQSGPVTARGRINMDRLAVAPMEPLSILVIPGADDSLVIYPSTQGPHGNRVQIARSLGIAYTSVRVIVPSVGGGFGGKSIGGLVDYVLCAAVARATKMAVRFVESRTDNLICIQGRGMTMDYELHATPDATVHALSVTQFADCGAYPTTNAVEPGKTQLMSCGPYRIPAVAFDGHSVMTNMAPSGAYRGPGRSEAAAVLEAGMDDLARQLGIDPVVVRRRNLLVPSEIGHQSPTGTIYDGTDYVAMLDRALVLSAYAELRSEQASRRAANDQIQLGIGLATVVDSSAWFARSETIQVSVSRTGRVEVRTTTASAGQDHIPMYTAIMAAILPVDPTHIDIVEGDTEGFHDGFGSAGSRTTQLAGSAVQIAGERVLEAFRRVAADALEAAPNDIEVTGGGFMVRGVPTRTMAFAEIAAAAHASNNPPPELDSPCTFEQDHATYPSMVAVVAVEIDTETGHTTVRSHHSVADCGAVLDERNAEGQIIGANAQAIGQVLFEAMAYDEVGNPRNANFAEYLIPSAPELPEIHVTEFTNVPSPANPLGAKGVGELGMVASPAALRAAVIDALAPFGVTTMALPCTPERVWHAITNAR